VDAIDGRIGLPFVTKSDVTDLVEEHDPKSGSWTYKAVPPRRGAGCRAVPMVERSM